MKKINLSCAKPPLYRYSKLVTNLQIQMKKRLPLFVISLILVVLFAWYFLLKKEPEKVIKIDNLVEKAKQESPKLNEEVSSEEPEWPLKDPPDKGIELNKAFEDEPREFPNIPQEQVEKLKTQNFDAYLRLKAANGDMNAIKPKKKVSKEERKQILDTKIKDRLLKQLEKNQKAAGD